MKRSVWPVRGERRWARRGTLVMALATTVTAAVATAAASSASSDNSESPSSRPLPTIASGAGVASIDGMTQIIGGSTPLSLSKGTAVPAYASLDAVAGLAQGWVDTGAIDMYGPPQDGKHGLQLPVPLAYAQQHPGPCEVFIRVLRFQSHDDALAALQEPELTGSYSPGYSLIDSGGVNGGIVAAVQSLANEGLDEYRFHWVSGNTWVEANVLGYDLALDAAQAVARQVQPHA